MIVIATAIELSVLEDFMALYDTVIVKHLKPLWHPCGRFISRASVHATSTRDVDSDMEGPYELSSIVTRAVNGLMSEMQ